MSLDTAKLVSDVLTGCCLLCVFVLTAVSSTSVQIGLVAAIIALLILLAVVNVAFMRCPFCNGQLARWQMDECPNCGSDLTEEALEEPAGDDAFTLGEAPDDGDASGETAAGEEEPGDGGFYV